MESGKLRCGVLACTGAVGQRFISLLENHPLFEVTVLAASAKTASEIKTFGELSSAWRLPVVMPEYAKPMPVLDANEVGSIVKLVDFVFSALDAEVATKLERQYAEHVPVFSNASTHRMDPAVPIIIPMANAEHIEAVERQLETSKGFIVTNANCSTTGLVVPLRALHDAFVIESFIVHTMQSISGAGLTGLPSMNILDNVIPFISQEEPKLETEPRKILGKYSRGGGFEFADIKISAHCNRVPVIDGHTETVSVKLKKKATPEQVKAVLRDFTSPAHSLRLSSAPERCIHVREEPDRPQPRLDRDRERGFAVSVGRIRECNVFDIKMVILSHNTVLGAAGGAILNAELAHAKSYLPRQQ